MSNYEKIHRIIKILISRLSSIIKMSYNRKLYEKKSAYMLKHKISAIMGSKKH